VGSETNEAVLVLFFPLVVLFGEDDVFDDDPKLSFAVGRLKNRVWMLLIRRRQI
jgi:hypothetical protein